MEKQLNELLADVIVESHKMLNCHWYNKGENFYAIHLKTEQLYHDFINMSDEIAELMLMMGYMPIANLKECLQIAHIKELRSQYIDENLVNEGMMIDFKYLLDAMINIKSLADETENDIVVIKLDEYIYYLSKQLWILNQSKEIAN